MHNVLQSQTQTEDSGDRGIDPGSQRQTAGQPEGPSQAEVALLAGKVGTCPNEPG